MSGCILRPVLLCHLCDQDSNEDEKMRNHVNEVEISKVFHELVAFRKYVLTDLAGVKPEQQWENLAIHMVLVYCMITREISPSAGVSMMSVNWWDMKC
jgi:hypothetical protein